MQPAYLLHYVVEFSVGVEIGPSTMDSTMYNCGTLVQNSSSELDYALSLWQIDTDT